MKSKYTRTKNSETIGPLRITIDLTDEEKKHISLLTEAKRYRYPMPTGPHLPGKFEQLRLWLPSRRQNIKKVLT